MAADRSDRTTEQWVTVQRFRDLTEAIVARGALEAADIRCFLRDENTVRMDWQISNFIGGMRLEVLQQDADLAHSVLHSGDEERAGLAKDGGEICPNCGSPDVHREQQRRRLSLGLVFLTGLPLPVGKRVWTCDACSHRWQDQD